MTDELQQAFEEFVSGAVKASLLYARSEWVGIAQQKLRSSREDYIAGISEVTMTGPYNGYIELKGKFPNMLETGFTGFDMKTGFANSPKRKTSKTGGWYLTIPYRHRTSGSVAPMPKDINKEAKKLGDRESLSEKLVASLGYKRETSHTGYRWKNAKFDGLTRVIKTYPSGMKRSQYLTFRRVSEKTDPGAWAHPGYHGLHAIDEVVTKTERFIYDYMKG